LRAAIIHRRSHMSARYDVRESSISTSAARYSVTVDAGMGGTPTMSAFVEATATYVRIHLRFFHHSFRSISCLKIVCFVLLEVMSTVHEILDAMDKLTREELRILKLGVDSRLADDDNDPALLASLKEAIAYADSHPAEAKSIDEVRALIPQWISESKSQARP
jgi:hypothetical protein